LEISLEKFLNDIAKMENIILEQTATQLISVKFSELIEELLKEGMEQIKEKKYYEKYSSREVSLLAVAFGENKEIGCKFENI
jgi:hypothetical protein